MVNENLILILVYEPTSPDHGPLPITRTADPRLITAVAEAAMDAAGARAAAFSQGDEVLGEAGRAEFEHLSSILKTLIPNLRIQGSHVVPQVM